MDDKRLREVKICPVHGEAMEERPDGLYCQHCDRLGRHGHVVVAACLNCGSVLLDIGHFMSCYPSIVLGWRCTEERLRDGREHVLHVSAVWGDHAVHPDADIVPGSVLNLFCPRCKAEFPRVSYCNECRAKVVRIGARHMYDGRDGFIEVCARWGCPQHRKVSPDESAAVAGPQVMCGGGRHMDIAAMRADVVLRNGAGR
ncbi:hypothetical protein HZB93_03645 [Candidatus Falkowbacteria bacterium]|nr:hypothetical protein [Candidatus Falkowbacteria bacterium]